MRIVLLEICRVSNVIITRFPVQTITTTHINDYKRITVVIVKNDAFLTSLRV